MAKLKIMMASNASRTQTDGDRSGLHLLSEVANNFFQPGIAQSKISIKSPHYNTHLANLPVVSACSSPTFTKPQTSPPFSALSRTEDLDLKTRDLTPSSPQTHLQEISSTHQKIQALYLRQVKETMENHGLYAPSLRASNVQNVPKTLADPMPTKPVATASKAKVERVVSKKTRAKLNYFKDNKAFPKRGKWMARFLELAEFKRKYGQSKVPHNFSDSPKLAEWQKFQRQQRKLFVKGEHSQLTPERVMLLEKIGFVWEARIDAWESHYQNLRDFREQHGHVCVPVANTVLSQWVKRQRKQYKKYEKGQKSSLTKDRVDRLNALGFVWDGRYNAY